MRDDTGGTPRFLKGFHQSTSTYGLPLIPEATDTEKALQEPERHPSINVHVMIHSVARALSATLMKSLWRAALTSCSADKETRFHGQGWCGEMAPVPAPY